MATPEVIPDQGVRGQVRAAEPWVLRHVLVVLVVGAVGAAAFSLAFWATEGEDKAL